MSDPVSLLMGSETSVVLTKKYVSSNPNIAYVKKEPASIYELERIPAPEKATCVFVLHVDDGDKYKIEFKDVPAHVFDSSFELEFVRGGQSGFIVKIKVDDKQPILQFYPSQKDSVTTGTIVVVPSSPVPLSGGKSSGWASTPAGKWNALVMHIYRKDGLRSLSEAMKKAQKLWKKR